MDSADLEHTDLEDLDLAVNGIRVHAVAAGSGPLVVLCHGFPESWYSWRHQLPALADAGYRAVALDMRGYGRTVAPARAEEYSPLHVAGDVIGVGDSLSPDEPFAVVGHDWGAPTAWFSAMFRPDRVRAVAGLSVPFVSPTGPQPTTPFERMALVGGDRDFYQARFSTDRAVRDLDRDPRTFLRRFNYALSGEVPDDLRFDGFFRRGVDMVDDLADCGDDLPSWLTPHDLDVYVTELSYAGFAGPLSWYRAADLSPPLLGPFVGQRIRVPSLFVAGTSDPVVAWLGDAIAALDTTCTDHRGTIMLDGAGHWTQQERPDEVNAALVDFLAAVGG